MQRRPRGSCSVGFWTGSRCFEPVWQRSDFRLHPGRLSASTREWWPEGSRTLSCGLSVRETETHHSCLKSSSIASRFHSFRSETWPVWSVPTRIWWRRILSERWPPHDRQRLITVTNKKRWEESKHQRRCPITHRPLTQLLGCLKLSVLNYF